MNIRPWTYDDQMPLIDNSFHTDFIYHAVRDGLSIRLERHDLEDPREKAYNMSFSEEDLFLIAVDDTEPFTMPFGFAIVEWEQWNRRANLMHLHVDRELRGKGIGTKLLEGAVAHAKDKFARHLFAETQNTNPAAIDWYLKHGFELNGFDLTLYDFDAEDELTYPDEFAVYFALKL